MEYKTCEYNSENILTWTMATPNIIGSIYHQIPNPLAPVFVPACLERKTVGVIIVVTYI